MPTALDQPASPPSGGQDAGGRQEACAVHASAALERALTQVARAVIRLSVPREGLGGDPRLDRAGYWLLVRVSEQEPVRLSELAEAADLDLSTVSRQMRDLVDAGLVDKVRDPHDGRASLLSLTPRGAEALAAVSAARRLVIADAVAGWTEEEKEDLASRLMRLGAGLPSCRPGREAAEVASESERVVPVLQADDGRRR